MWARFRKKGVRGGDPAPDLIPGVRALQALFFATAGFLVFEWFRGRELPFSFLGRAAVLEAALYFLLWALFRLGRLKRKTMHRLALWVAAGLSLPVSVYLTLVDAGGEIRFTLLLIWFLAYGRNYGIFLTALYLSGTASLLFLSGKFDFFAGNDPLRSLVRASLLSVTLLPLMLHLRSRLSRTDLMPVRLTHLLMELQRRIQSWRSGQTPGLHLSLPAGARKLWSRLRNPERSSPFQRVGPRAGSGSGVLVQFTLFDIHRFADPQLSPEKKAEVIHRRMEEFRTLLEEEATQHSLWTFTAESLYFWYLQSGSNTEETGPSRQSPLEKHPSMAASLALCRALVQKFRQDRSAAVSRGMDFPAARITCYSGTLLLLANHREEIQAWPLSWQEWPSDRPAHPLEFCLFEEGSVLRRFTDLDAWQAELENISARQD
ncbi:MAG: hypothetical protein KDK25_15230 [Leptospiraceae bacterium]|nr:hypothetical protein [Leptospiraceae bacterium]